MFRPAESRTRSVTVASVMRLAFGCLILVSCSTAVVAAPALVTLTRVVSSESESPLETDECSMEAALPRSLGCLTRLSHRRMNALPRGCRFNSRRTQQAFRCDFTEGHRLANGLTAPMRL